MHFAVKKMMLANMMRVSL